MLTCRVTDRRSHSTARHVLTRRVLPLGSAHDGDLLDWYPSQVKGPVDDEVQEGRTTTTTTRSRCIAVVCLRLIAADLISTIEFNENGELLAVGDKGGRIVIFQREQQVSAVESLHCTCSGRRVSFAVGSEATDTSARAVRR
jgi:hypothetical protein